MSEVELRRAYYEGRILIEASRILDSPFADSLVCLSGAEQELLRNLTMYLHRRASFVDTYYDGYYSMPDDEDWDDVSAIVASLEEKLMGCGCLGLPEDASEYKSTTTATTSAVFLEFVAVPEGYVRYVDACWFTNSSQAQEEVQLQLYQAGSYRPCASWDDPAIDHPEGKFERLTLFEGHRLRFRFTGHPIGAVLRAICVAHDCTLPE